MHPLRSTVNKSGFGAVLGCTALLLLCLFALVCCGFTVFAEGGVPERERPVLSHEDEVLDFSPDGYFPEAVCSIEELKINISYFAINRATGESESFPLYGVGEYQIVAVLAESEEYGSAECSWNVVINPVEAFIVTERHTVAHTAMANPVPYKVEPEWAAEYLDIKISYQVLENLSEPAGERINIPVSPGLYYTVFDVESSSEGVLCRDKCLVYGIAERQGKVLSYSEARASVPEWFYCTVEDLNEVYDGFSVEPTVAIYPAAAEFRLLYRELKPDGSLGPSSEDAPADPGDYRVEAYVLDKMVGGGQIVIAKLVPDIIMESAAYTYNPEGIYPSTASTVPAGIELTYRAYLAPEGEEVSVETVEVPIVGCGRFMILASPVDTEHYEEVRTHAFITVNPAVSAISAEAAEYSYDGTEKEALFTVTPEWAEYEVEYLLLDGNGGLISRSYEKPVEAGDYLAVISVSARDYISSSTAAVSLRILPVETPKVVDDTADSDEPLGLLAVNAFFSASLILWLMLALKKREAKIM